MAGGARGGTIALCSTQVAGNVEAVRLDVTENREKVDEVAGFGSEFNSKPDVDPIHTMAMLMCDVRLWTVFAPFAMQAFR